MPIRFLMGFNTTDLPENFNDRFRNVFRMGIFAGGEITRVGPLQVAVSPFVAVSCDGGVVRDDVDTQILTIPAGKPNGVYICLLAKYRNMDEPQLEWKVVDPSCLQSCDDADCFIIFGLVVTDTDIVSATKYDAHRLDPCNKEDYNIYQTLANLPVAYVGPDGIVHSPGTTVGRIAFVVETRMFYWWNGLNWIPVSMGNRVVVVVFQDGSTGEVNVDAGAGDVFIIVLSVDAHFNPPSNPQDGKIIEFRLYSETPLRLSWDVSYVGSQATIPHVTSGFGLQPYSPDRIFFECVAATHSITQWIPTFRDTDNVVFGFGADAPFGVGDVAIGRNATIGNLTDGAIAIGVGATIGENDDYSIAIGLAATVASTSPNATAIGYGSSIGGLSSYAVALRGTVADAASGSTAIGGGHVGTGASGSVAIGNAQVDANAYWSVVIGSGWIPNVSSAIGGLIFGAGSCLIEDDCPNSILIGTNLSSQTSSEQAVVIGTNSRAIQGSISSVVIGTSCVSESGSNNCVVMGSYSSVFAGEYSVVIGTGDGTPFNPSPSEGNPVGDFASANSSTRMIVIGSKVLVDAGCQYSNVQGWNIWAASGSSSSVILGNTIRVEQGSKGSIAIGGVGPDETYNMSGATVRSAIIRSADCIAIGRAIEIIDMGSDRTHGAGRCSASIGIGSYVSMNGVAAYSGSNIGIGNGISLNNTSLCIAIGKLVTIGAYGPPAVPVYMSVAVCAGSGVGDPGARVFAHKSTALGVGVKIADGATDALTTERSIAIGYLAQIDTGSLAAIVIGSSARASGSSATNSIAIGNDTQTTGANAIAIGWGASAGANQCNIGYTGASGAQFLNRFTVNVSTDEPSPLAISSFRVERTQDGSSGEGDDDPVIGVAHKTSIMVRLNTRYSDGLKRVYAWEGGDISTLAASYPNARVLFLAN